MDTKTSLSGLDVIWSTDDRVAIFNGTTEMKEYKVKAGYDGKTTTTLTPVNKDFTAGTEGSDMDANVAFYPSSVINSCSKSETGFSLSVNLPNTIKYAPTSFGEGSMPMVAVTDSKNDYNLSFKNLFGIIKLQLKGDGVIVYSITISGNSDEKISGEASVSCSYGANPTISFDNYSNTSIVLNCGDGIELSPEKSTPFYIAVPPVKFTSGITMRVTTSKGIVEKKSSKSLEIERSKITPLSEVFIVCKQQENNQILYSTVDNEIMNFSETGNEIVSNEYMNGIGIITFKRDVNSIWLRSNNKLKTIVIPASARDIMFKDCGALASVVILNGLVDIQDNAFNGCKNLLTINIPNSVATIGKSAFDYCTSLTSINIPERVTSIADYTFSNCHNLSFVQIPKGVTRIGMGAFNGCRNLMTIDIPNSVTNIEKHAFVGCSSLTSIFIPKGVTCINSFMFSDCVSLTSVKIPEGVTSIENYSFASCISLVSVEVPKSVTTIREGAFKLCSHLKSIEIPDGVDVIPYYAFEGCINLSSVKIPSSVNTIYEGAFSRCENLASITIPEGVVSIGERAFSDCINLESVIIPASVSTIGMGAFFTKDKIINHIELYAKNPPSLNSFSFGSGQEIYVLPECVDIYMKNSSWNKYVIKPIE